MYETTRHVINLAWDQICLLNYSMQLHKALKEVHKWLKKTEFTLTKGH